MRLTPSPLSAFASTSILPVTSLPATKRGDESDKVTLTLWWCAVVFIGSMAEVGVEGCLWQRLEG